MVFLPIMLLAAAASATPAPAASSSPAPLKVIIKIRSRALCTDLHQVIMPFVSVEKQNNERFVTMNKEIAKYHEWYRPAADANLDPDGNPEYNGAQALAAGKIDQTAAMMYADITRVEKAIKRSEQQTPPGRDPQLDELRERAQRIAELQRQLADRYEAQAGTYLNSLGSYMPKGDPALQSEFDIPELQPEPLQAAQLPSVTNAISTPAPGSAFGTVDPSAPKAADVAKTLFREEVAFLAPAVKAVHTCDG
jgi:hypothetical protein